MTIKITQGGTGNVKFRASANAEVHTGEVTGSGTLTVDKTAISNQSDTVILATDTLLFGDTSDSNNLKKDTVQGILDLVPAGGGAGVPIGSVVAWMKNISGVGTLDAEFVECNGGSVSDGDSPINGQAIPQLNAGYNRFLRGNGTSGTTTGSSTHRHNASFTLTLPTIYTGMPSQTVPVQSSTGYGVQVAGACHTHTITIAGISKTISTSDASSLPPSYNTVFVMRIK